MTAAGFFFDISATEWCICLILFGLILGLELVNTAVEAVVDLVTEEKKPLAKLAKDTAAGAVLIAAIMAASTYYSNRKSTINDAFLQMWLRHKKYINKKEKIEE